jgi:RNA polymerase sigma-70 factor (ECF subfamily)
MSPLARESDDRLCSRAAAGDTRAFNLLVARHENRLRAFLTHVAGRDLADELAQESFLKAWQSMPSFRGEARFSSWICAIGWRSFLDHVRRERGEARKKEAASAESVPAPLPTPDAALDLSRALALLEPVERASLVLCEGHGWSHSEAAAILGIPLGTLKGTVMRAKRKCRATLDSNCS